MIESTFIGKGEVRGFVFNLVRSSEKAYIYRVKSEDIEWYEVFKHKVSFGKVSYPTSKAFGIWAKWTYSLDVAEDIFKRINSGELFGVIPADL